MGASTLAIKSLGLVRTSDHSLGIFVGLLVEVPLGRVKLVAGQRRSAGTRRVLLRQSDLAAFWELK